MSTHSEIIAQRDRQTDTQTHRQTGTQTRRKLTSTAYAGGNNLL